MATTPTAVDLAAQNTGVFYGELPLVELIERIVRNEDRLALREFHERRTVFRYGHSGPLLLAEYVDLLHQEKLRCRHGRYVSIEVVDDARDLTINRFLYLPSADGASEAGKNSRNNRGKRQGINCRGYFRAFLEFWDKTVAERRMSQVEAETRSARALQTHVAKHFEFALGECQRRVSGPMGRYTWQVNGTGMHLFMPSRMTGAQKRSWLEQNATPVDPTRPGERERVQDIIDHRLRVAVIAFTDMGDIPAECKEPWETLHDISATGLAEVIAQEKADNIDQLRPSIGRLGRKALKRMIRRIFGDVSEGHSRDGEVASEFGLSKATFSRFAGSRWAETGANSPSIPDLWLNTARILSNTPVFREAAQERGIWRRVEATLAAAGKDGLWSISDE